jgi:hypothetical protein
MVKRSTYEDDLQIAVAQYLDLQGWLWCHCPNGARMGGKNPRMTGAIMKGFGLKRGVPDILIFERWAKYNDDEKELETGFGIAVELKSPRGQITIEQVEWLSALRARGWLAIICRTINEVVAVCEAVRGERR